MEIIRLTGGDYFEYETLLLKRDALEREAGLYLNEYTRVFGELFIEQYRAYIRCIELKKKIAFCQAAENCGAKVNEAELDAYISCEMEEYFEKLADMVTENELCRSAETVPEIEIRKIKKIYRSLAKQLHPDISPLTAEHHELLDLWNRAVTAYNCNSLKEIEEVQLLVNSFLERNGIEHADMVIPDIDAKTELLKAEIDRIISTDPYQYKFLLQDEQLAQEKKEELRESIEEMTAYSNQLEAVLDGILGKE